MNKLHSFGNIIPFLFKYLSRANIKLSNIDSNNKKYPIHSETMASTFSTGKLTSSILPLIGTITSSNPFSLKIQHNMLSLIEYYSYKNVKDLYLKLSIALYSISASSTAKTLTACALAINIDSIPLPVPKSNIVLPLNEGTFCNIAEQ